MRNKIFLAVFGFLLCPLISHGTDSSGADSSRTGITSPSSLSVKNGYELVFSGKMLFEMPFGENQKQQTFLFNGSGFSKLFQKTVTPFDTYNANNMFLLNSSRFGITASREFNNWKSAFVGMFNLNQGAGGRGQVREAYVLLDNPLFGTLAMGNTYGIEEVASMGPTDIIQGSGGIAGSFFKFVAPTTGVLNYPSMIGDTGTATKIRYITARIKEGPLKGLQFATSYTPNTMHKGEASLNTGVSPLREPFAPFDLNSVALGVNYLTQWQSGSFGLSFTSIQAKTQAEKPLLAQKAKAQVTEPDTGVIIENGAPALTGLELNRHPTKCYQVGGVLSLGPVSFAAEYISNGKSHILSNNFNPIIRNQEGDIVSEGISPGTITFNGSETTFESKEYVANEAGDGRVLNFCIGYTGERYGMSLSYLQSSVKTGFLGANQTTSYKATCNGCVLSTQYNGIPGLVPYLELGTFKLTNPDWAYTATMIPSLTQFDFSAVPGKDSYTNAAILGLKVQF